MPNRKWYDWFRDTKAGLDNRLPVSGYADFTGSTTTAVTFTTPELASDYDVSFCAPDVKSYWATSKATSGFTANVSSSVTATVRWILYRA